MPNPTLRRRANFARIVFGVLLLACVLLLGGGYFATRPLPPMPEALAALEADARVQVQTQPYLAFSPRNQMPQTGLIIYPGARVDERAYAPTARAIAQHGFLVVIPDMPLHLALLSPERATQVATLYPAVHRWALAGHSLGGVVAASFVKQNRNSVVKGLALWAAYPADADDLSTFTHVAMISIFGTQDKLYPPEKIDAARARLSPATQFVTIAGGNHAQFGYYGAQAGDGAATISREQQQAQLVKVMVEFLQTLR